MKSKIHEHKKNNLKMVSKKTLYLIFALMLCSNFTFGQTLMSDEDHFNVMATYAVNLNTVLVAECPQGITIDQFKKKVVNGELTLSSTAQASILTYAAPLKVYGSDFATAKGLLATTDAYKYFYSSFAPSTIVQNSKLVEGIPNIGLTGLDMWNCALENITVSDCGLNVLVSDKRNVNNFSNAAVTLLTNQIGVVGVLIMLNGLSECFYDYNNKYFQLINQDYSYLINKPEILQKLENLAGTTIDPFSDTLYFNEYGFSIDIGDFSYLENREDHSYSFEINNEVENQPTFKNLIVSTRNYIDYKSYIIEYPELNNTEMPIIPLAITELKSNNQTARIIISDPCVDWAIVRKCVFTPSDGSAQQIWEHCKDVEDCFSGSGDGHAEAGCVKPKIYSIVNIDIDCMSGITPGPPAHTNPVVSPSNPVYGGPRGGDTPIENLYPIIKPRNPSLVNNFLNPFITTPALPKITIPTEPCVTIKNIGANSIEEKQAFLNAVNDLKEHVEGPNIVEVGFEAKSEPNEGEFTEVFTNVLGEGFAVDLTVSIYNFGGGHTHPVGGIPMFSFGDVYSLLKSYEGASLPYEIKPKVFDLLVCKDKLGITRTYIIKVNNISKLKEGIKQELAKYKKDPDVTTEPEKIDEAMFAENEKYKSCGGEYEKNFLQRYSDFGISLYETTDEYLNEWNEKKLSTAPPPAPLTVESIPCN